MSLRVRLDMGRVYIKRFFRLQLLSGATFRPLKSRIDKISSRNDGNEKYKRRYNDSKAETKGTSRMPRSKQKTINDNP